MTSDVSFSTRFTGKEISPQTPKRKRIKKDKFHSSVGSPYFIPNRRIVQVSETDNLSVDPSPSRSDFSSLSTFLNSPTRNALSAESSITADLMERLNKLKPLLIQEKVADNPWKVLIAVTLLNKTAGKLAIPVFWKIVDKWPTPLDLANAQTDELVAMIHHLGTQRIRARRLIDLSRIYMREPPSMYDLRTSRVSSSPQRKSRFFKTLNLPYPSTPVSHLPGAGTYALDSYRIFCTVHDNPTSEEWKLVRPTDKELIRYLRWKWAFTEHLEWSSSKGATRPVTLKYVTALIADLENNAL